MRSVQTEEDGTSSRNIFLIIFFLIAPAQSLSHEFSDAQISQHCNKRKLADIARRERDISRYLFASAPHHYRNLHRTRGADYLLRTSSVFCSPA